MTTAVDRSRSDFNFSPPDTGGDILWRDQAGDDVLWLMDNNMPFTVATLPTVTPDWHLKAAANFDASLSGIGDADLLWQNDNGALALWQMTGTTVSAVHALPNPGPTWHVVGDNDFDGDHGDDILFQNDNGALAMWTGISAAMGTVSGMIASVQNPGPSWHVVATGDTGGDGIAGILWQNDNGALVLWEDPAFVGGVGGPLTFQFNTVATLPTVDPSWHVKGMADLNGDNRADIVFQNDNGAVAVWEMGGAAGTTITATNLVNLNPGPAWHIAGLRDMTNDGGVHPDILFQNDNGAAAVWEGYHSLGGGSATFTTVLAITPNPNPNGHVWDLL